MLFGCSERNSRNENTEDLSDNVTFISEDAQNESDQLTSADVEQFSEATTDNINDDNTETVVDFDESDGLSSEEDEIANTDKNLENVDDIVSISDQNPVQQPIQEEVNDNKPNNDMVHQEIIVSEENIEGVQDISNEYDDVSSSDNTDIDDQQLETCDEDTSESQSEASQNASDSQSELSHDNTTEGQNTENDEDAIDIQPETDENGCYMNEDGNWVCPMPAR